MPKKLSIKEDDLEMYGKYKSKLPDSNRNTVLMAYIIMIIGILLFTFGDDNIKFFGYI